MEIERLEDLSPRAWLRPAVAVGNFDGVHRGHRALVASAVADARSRGGTAVALTFDPHPSRVLAPERAPLSLTTLEQKAELLAGLGVDVLAVIPFDWELSREEPERFAEVVLGRALGARLVAVGTSFRFGRGRAGDPALLASLGARLGFVTRIVEPVHHEGAPISSSRVREALARGAVEAAAAMLGRAHCVDGLVVRGDERGRGLGFPTANVESRNEIVACSGVYACWAEGRAGFPARHAAVVNIGHRPTFGGRPLGIEVHLLGFSGDLYGRELRVSFVRRLREERRFPSPAALVEQIEKDAAEARSALGGPGVEMA